MPFSVREGINIFLDGFVPTENLRFRETVLTFRVVEKQDEEEIKRLYNYQYPNMSKNLGDFELQVASGSFTDSEIIVLLVSLGDSDALEVFGRKVFDRSIFQTGRERNWKDHTHSYARR